MREQVIRIALRYLAIGLVAQGWFSSEDGSMFASDPDVAMFIDMGVGFAIAGATEVWFWLAAKWKERNTITIEVPEFKGENV